jgi:hypothetical protein
MPSYPLIENGGHAGRLRMNSYVQNKRKVPERPAKSTAQSSVRRDKKAIVRATALLYRALQVARYSVKVDFSIAAGEKAH